MEEVHSPEEGQSETINQLLSMGFSYDVSTQALSATASNSATAAANWILSQNPNPNSSPNPNFSPNPNPNLSPNTNPNPNQLKIHKFFRSPINTKQESFEKEEFRAKRTRRESDTSLPNEPEPQISIKGILEDSLPIKRKSEGDTTLPSEPLWERMRPRDIDEVLGQDHILGEKTLLKSAIDCDRLPSIILWGPPGTGKTSIARAILNTSLSRMYRFVSLSAVTSGVKDIRDAVDGAKKAKAFSKKRTVLFIDEVHRFNKSQQDSFLPVIEDGSVIFMGATTENPSFHLITPLLSRCKVLTLNPLGPDQINTLLERAVANTERGLLRSVVGVGSVSGIEVDDVAIRFLAGHCDGDARVALNALEISATTAAARLIPHQGEAENHIFIDENDDSVSIARVTFEDAKEALQSKHIAYDKTGEEHYNLISALHKSMRGSDADAAIYWLARMLEGGEEPLYISRRLIRFASEDIGLADPLALSQAVACYQACHFIGMPECNVCLAQCVAYLALAPKSVSVYKAIEAARKVVKDSVGQNEGVPLHLRNAPTKLMKELGYGKGYIYPPDDFAMSSQTYLPESLQGYKFLHWPDKKTHN